MAGRAYHFITRIELTAGAEVVWDALADVEGWPRWWRYVSSVDVVAGGDADGAGGRFDIRSTTPLRYSLRYAVHIQQVLRPRWVRVEVEGDLAGVGECDVRSSVAGVTQVEFHWVATTPKRWMRVMAPLAAPVFVWSHGKVMIDFAGGLAKATGGRLLSVSNTSLRASDQGFGGLPGAPTR